MVRNSKRRAFTIVELVIVIAVIAILAAVMIPTFGGVIESANVSADKQMLAGVNSQIGIYLGTGNNIDTEADLWKALEGKDKDGNPLTGGTDYTGKLNPKSAKHGYHYWYNGATQRVELLSAKDLTDDYGFTVAKGLGRMVVFADDVQPRETVSTFAEASPRAFINDKRGEGNTNNLYFLDKVVVDENGRVTASNEFSDFFHTIENLSTADVTINDYNSKKTTIDGMADKRGDNKDFASALVERMKITAIFTDEGVIEPEDALVHPCVPANKTEGTYTIEGGVDLEIADNFSGLVIPENVNLGDGALKNLTEKLAEKFPEQIKVDITITYSDEADLKAKIETVFGAQSVKGSFTINGSIVAESDGDKITAGDVVAELKYKNPVSSFNMDVDAVNSNIVNTHIALAGIKNSNNKFKLQFKTDTFKGQEGNTLPVYEEIEWTIVDDVAGVSVKNGVVSFNFDSEKGAVFTADKFTVKASAKAVNDTPVVREYTVNVVEFTGVTTTFNDIEVPVTSTSVNVVPGRELFIGVATDVQGNVIAKAGFSNDLTYTYGNKNFDLTKLNVDPVVTIASTGDYFTLKDGTWNFAKEKITALGGGFAWQNVTISVNDGATSHSATIPVKVKDNTNAPYAVATPIYTAKEKIEGDDGDLEEITYRYRVGNVNTLAISEIFVKKNVATTGSLDDHAIFVFNKEAYGSYYSMSNLVETYKLTDTEFNFSDGTKYTEGKTYYLVLSTIEYDQYGKQVVNGNKNAASVVEIVIVDNGVNITNETGFKTPVAAGQSLVLHNDLVDYTQFGESTGAYVNLNAGSIYGNYFKVNASKFYDTNSTTSGYSFINMTNGGSINQFILEGPVYPVQCLQASDSDNYFCFGITLSANITDEDVTNDTIEINDSYLFGFASPVFVSSCVNFNATNTVFEGGTLSNVYIRKAVTDVNFTNVKTIQNRQGYGDTFDQGKTMLGMGIFVHKDQNTDLKFNFVDVEQYNWLHHEQESLGKYTGTAIGVIYARKHGVAGDFTGQLNKSYKDYGHTVSGKVYVNAAIASVMKSCDITIVSKNSQGETKYTYKPGEGTGLSDYAAWVSTYQHDSNCSCAANVDFVYGGFRTAAIGTNFN